MARPTVSHDIISSRGVKLDLVGIDVTVVYTFAALALVEDEFGSVQLALGALAQKVNQAKTTARLLACGLAHEVGPDGEPLSDVDCLYPFLDTARADDYQEAIVDALANALPAVRAAIDRQEEETEPDPTEGETTTDSPGPTGTTSPPSSSDDPTPSSGP